MSVLSHLASNASRHFEIHVKYVKEADVNLFAVFFVVVLQQDIDHQGGDVG